LKIGICVKQVPDTETKIRITDTRDWISEEGVKFIISPYDEYALEEGLKAKEKFGGEVTTITVGPKRAQEAIRTALSMGADRSIHVVCEDYKLEPLTVAKALKEVIAKEGLDLVFMGKQAIDRDFSGTGPMLSELLGWPCANITTKIEYSADGKTITAEREIEGGSREVLEMIAPAIITATKGLNTPRYPSLKGIMAAKKKEIKEMALADLGLAEAAGKISLKLENFRLPPERKAGMLIEAEPKEAAAKVASLLRNEAKVI
jgi:electron transfer flavoprotein beta subunit